MIYSSGFSLSWTHIKDCCLLPDGQMAQTAIKLNWWLKKYNHYVPQNTPFSEGVWKEWSQIWPWNQFFHFVITHTKIAVGLKWFESLIQRDFERSLDLLVANIPLYCDKCYKKNKCSAIREYKRTFSCPGANQEKHSQGSDV